MMMENPENVRIPERLREIAFSLRADEAWNQANWIDAAADEIERLRSLTTWQPIETAPKDKTWVVGIHKDRTEGIAAMRFVKPHWMTATGNSARPTHWLPLPTPPEADT